MTMQNNDDKKYIRKLNMPTTLDEKTRTIKAVIATSIPAEIYDYKKGEIVNESLMIDGMTMYEGDKAPLIDSHDPMSSIKNILGTVSNVKIEGEELIADITFAETEEGNRAFQLVKDGHLRKLSVGYSVTEATYLNDGESIVYNGKSYTGPLKLSTKWELFEVSCVSIPADVKCNFKSKNEDTKMINTNVNDNVDGKDNDIEIKSNNVITGELKMDEVKKEVTVDEKSIVKQERARVKSIREAASLAGIKDESFVNDLVDGEVTLDNARAKILEKIGEERAKVTADFSIINKKTDRSIDNVEISFRNACGFKLNEKELEQLDRTSDKVIGLQGLARSVLEKHNIDTRYMSSTAIADKVLNDRAISTDFSYMLNNVANKQAAIVFENSDVTYKEFAKEISLSDFKSTYLTGLKPWSTSTVVTEGSNPNNTSAFDAGQAISLSKFHDKYVLSFESIVNDDLDLFASVPDMMANGALGSVERKVYEYLIGNTELTDGDAIFTSAAGNIKTSGATISVAGLDEAYAAMISQQSNGRYLNMSPKVIIVPPAQYATASGIVGSQYLQGTTTADSLTYTANNYRGVKVLTTGLLTDSTISGYDANAWYVLADKMYGGVVVAGLRGQEVPRITSRSSIAGEAAGVIFDMLHFFGVTVGNRSAIYKNDGGA